MSHRNALTRLFRLRKMEEETRRMALEAAVVERNRIEADLRTAAESEHRARCELRSQVANSDTVARVGALMAMHASEKWKAFFQSRLERTEEAVERMRAEYLGRRVARQQVESLVERNATLEREQELRRTQQSLDDWFNRKGLRVMAERGASTAGVEGPTMVDAEDRAEVLDERIES